MGTGDVTNLDSDSTDPTGQVGVACVDLRPPLTLLVQADAKLHALVIGLVAASGWTRSLAVLEDKAVLHTTLPVWSLLMTHHSYCRYPEQPWNTGQPRLMIVTRQVTAFSAAHLQHLLMLCRYCQPSTDPGEEA